MPKRNNRPSSAVHPDLVEVFGEPISVYTREQALEDGTLVDVTPWAGSGPDGMLGGFTAPVALTRALWEVIDVDDPTFANASWQARARAGGESTRGRAHDVLWMATIAARRAPTESRVQFSVLLTKGDNVGRPRRQRVALQAHCDGDGVTIGFPEDF